MGWLFSRKPDSNQQPDNGGEESPNFREGMRISGPFASGNLSVFLIHNQINTNLKDVLTLEEAFEKQKVVVEETGTVNKLRIKNLGESIVFIQSGDIVMGGKQDRTLQFDMLLTPKSGFLPIDAFCVEQARWHKRAGESADQFSSSHHHLSNKSLKMAAKYHGSQNEVWNEVRSTQMRYNSHTQEDTQSGISPSSLPLNLQNEKVQQAIEKYLKDLSDAPTKESDVLGYAFAINGELSTIDVYSCPELFKKMWPKLLKAAAMEAFDEGEREDMTPPPTAEQVLECMADAERQKEQQKHANGETKTILKESQKNVLFETRFTEANPSWIHRNYLTRK